MLVNVLLRDRTERGRREGEKEKGGKKVYMKRDRETEWEEKRERVQVGT